MKRQVFKLLLTCIIALSALVGCKPEEPKKSEETIKWKIHDGTLTISGIGKIKDNSQNILTREMTNNNPWDKYRESVQTLVIEDGITDIGYYAFYDYNNLLSITIPKTITTIKPFAFARCYNLQTVNYNAINCTTMNGYDVFWYDTSFITLNIGNQVKTIPKGAFSFCDLTSVTIPNSVTSIGEDAFTHCHSLTSITLSNGITTINDNTFSVCENLRSVIVPDGVTSIGEGAFLQCTSLTSILLPSSVTSIGEGAFWGCASLESIIVPDSVTNIGDMAFEECISLTSITIPGNISKIGGAAFRECRSLTSVIIPNSVKSIGQYAFNGCMNLTLITNLNPNPVKIDYTTFNLVNKSSCTLKVPSSAVSAYQNAYGWKEFNIVGM